MTALRLVQWTTGNVARESVRAVLGRTDMEIVGVFADSPGKVGVDLAELCGLGDPTGILATDDVAALLSLHPDCVIYTPLHFDVAEVSRILERGINVVTTAEFLTGRNLGGDREVLERAALSGDASLFGSGMNPGFVQVVAAAAAGASAGPRHVRVTESVDVSLYAGDANFDDYGWGRPTGEPGHADDIERATSVFAEGADVLARVLGIEADELRCTVEFAAATTDLDLPGRPIAAGTVGGIDVRWEVIHDGAPVIELHERWVMSSQLDPAWKVEHGWIVEVTGDPRIRIKLDVWPDTEDLGSLTTDDLHSIGMRLTAVPLVNAIPAVCAAPPGIATYATLPLVSGNIATTRPTSSGKR